MAGSFQDKKFFIAISDIFMRQSGWDVAVDNTDINKRHPMATPIYPSSQVTREKIPDCSGEYFIAEDLTSRLKRLRFGFYPSAQLASGWLALALGAAANPTGTPANETQTITVTGNPWSLAFTFEGLSGETDDLPETGVTAAQVQDALNALRPIKQGSQNAMNAVVSGSAGGPFTVTFQGKLANANVPLLVGTNATITAGTAGANKLHALSRSTPDQPPQTSMIYGFEGDSDNPQKVKNLVVNEFAISGQARGRVLVELDIITTWPYSAGVYSPANCVTFKPIMTKDCRLAINGIYHAENLRTFRYTYSNNIITGDDAFPFDDIDAIRLERGDRTSSFAFTVFGSKGDALYTLAESEPQEDVALHIGRPGDRLSIYAPSTKLRLADEDITFIGDANRSAINIEGEPFLDENLVGTPDYAEANIDQTTAFLTT